MVMLVSPLSVLAHTVLPLMASALTTLFDGKGRFRDIYIGMCYALAPYVLIQLPNIEINHRRPHGGNGASYLPIHCDAAVGNSELNQRWINNYPFPIRIEACSNDDGALCVQIYRAD